MKKDEKVTEAPNAQEEDTSKNQGLVAEFEEMKRQNESLQAQKEHFRTKAQKAEEEVDALKLNPPPPSEIENADALSSFDMLSPTEQGLLKKQKAMREEMDNIKADLGRSAMEMAREKAFDEIVSNKSFTSIANRKEEFMTFCGEAMPSEVLAKAFLFDEVKEMGAKEEKETKRPGLEGGSGGDRKAPSTEISMEQREHLRINDPKKYMDYITRGIIKP